MSAYGQRPGYSSLCGLDHPRARGQHAVALPGRRGGRQLPRGDPPLRSDVGSRADQALPDHHRQLRDRNRASLSRRPAGLTSTDFALLSS